MGDGVFREYEMMRTRLGLPGLALVVMTCVTANARAGTTLSGRMLSKRETIAATKFEAGDSSVLSLYRRANPDARQDLWEIISDPKKASQHASALMMIGYVGGDEDPSKIEALLNSTARKPFGHLSRMAAEAAIAATAIMSKRGNKNATQLLEKMKSIKFWKDKHSLFVHPKILEKNPEERLWALYFVGEGFCYSGEKDFGAIVNSLKSQASGAREKAFVDRYIRKKRLDSISGVIRKAEAAEPPKKLLALVKALAAKNARSESDPGKARDDGVARTAKRDIGNSITTDIDAALSVYEDCLEAMRKRNYRYLALHLADNGRPFIRTATPTKERIAKVSGSLVALQDSMAKTVKLHEDMKASSVKYSNAIARYSQEMIVEELGRGSGKLGDVRRRSTVTVTVSINGAEKALRAFGRVNRSGVTFDSQGRLQIVMVLVNNRWHWNPFLW